MSAYSYEDILRLEQALASAKAQAASWEEGCFRWEAEAKRRQAELGIEKLNRKEEADALRSEVARLTAYLKRLADSAGNESDGEFGGDRLDELRASVFDALAVLAEGAALSSSQNATNGSKEG